MRGLLDTQTFLWLTSADPRLSSRARDFALDDSNEIFLSAVVPWEISIKHSAGRLPQLTEGPEQYVLSRMAQGPFRPLAIEIRHALQIAQLPLVHRDPFDRMLVAQAQVEGLAILTSDPQIARYDVEVIW